VPCGTPFPGRAGHRRLDRGEPTVPAFVALARQPGFQAEELKSFELGYRGELGGKVSIDLAAFHNLYDGLLGLEPQSLTVDAGRIVGTVTSGNSLEGVE
jgi:phage FluMu gp28-like protein